MIFLFQSALAASPEDISVNGFFDLEYEKTIAGEGGDESGSLDLHHLNLLTSYTVNDALVIRTHIEWEHAFDSTSGGLLRLEYGFAEYRLSDQLLLRLGRVMTPMGIYNELHDATPAFPTYAIPHSIYKAHKMGGEAFFPKFQTALMGLGRVLLGTEGALHYDFYIGQGTNVLAWDGEKDDNTNKSVGANLRLALRPGVSLYAAGYHEQEPTLDDDGALAEEEIPVSTGYLGLAIDRRLLVELEGIAGRRDASTQWATSGLLGVHVSRVTPYARYLLLEPVGARSWEAGAAVDSAARVRLKGEVHRVMPGEGETYLEARSSFTVAF